MPEQEDQLSPEEKLLQNMQGRDDEASPKGASGAAGEGVKGSGKLRLAKKPVPADESGQGESPAADDDLIGASPAAAAVAEEPDEADKDETGTMAAAAKPMSHHFGIGTLNKLLAVAVLAIIGVAAFQVVSSVQAMQVPPAPPADLIEWGEEPEEDLPPLEELLKSFETRPILRGPEQVVQQQQPVNQPQQKPQLPAAVKHVKEHFDLIGLSTRNGGREAIVLDRKEGKMHFVRVGQDVSLKGQALNVVSIGADSVVLTDGEQKVTVK